MESKQLLKLDGSDSEEFKEFELPPARARRPRMRKALAEAKASGGGRSICSFRCCVLFVISAVLCGAILLMGWMLMNIEKDLEDMKEKIRLVKSDEQSDLLHSKNIQTSVSQKLASITKDEKEIAELKMKVKILSLQVKKLNSTISEMKSQKDSSAAPPNINKDLALLKKGMADTGVDIKKLSDENEASKKTVTLLSKLVRSLKKDVSELKDAPSGVDNDGTTEEPVDTLPPLVATTSPADKAKESKKSLKKLSSLMKKLVDGYGELFSNKTKKLKLELLHLKKDVLAFNNTAKLKFIALENTVKMLQNITSSQWAEFHSAVAKLNGKSFDAENKTSDGKVLRIVKGILVSLKSQQSIISNLTRKMSGIEKLVSEDRDQKREDSENSAIDGEGMPHTTEKPQTEAPEELLKTTEESIAESTSKSDVPSTTGEPMKMMSSKEVEAKVSPSLSMIELTTTPSVKSTETEVVSTTSLPSTSQADNINLQTEPRNTSQLNMTNVPLMTTAEPISQKIINATHENKTLTDTTGLDKSPQTTSKTNSKQLVDATNNGDLTAETTASTRKPKPVISNMKATTKSLDGLEVLDGGSETGFDSAASMAENKGHRRKTRKPLDLDIDSRDDPFSDDLGPSEEWENDRRSQFMNSDEIPSNGRSRHGATDQSDSFDTLDQLDDST